MRNPNVHRTDRSTNSADGSRAGGRAGRKKNLSKKQSSKFVVDTPTFSWETQSSQRRKDKIFLCELRAFA
jgi:hypothetical protein